MCGIVGYVGKRNAQDVLLDGLEKLEYRGYDSAGVALTQRDGIRVVKSKGRLSTLRSKLEELALPQSSCGIGHTRWARRGWPSGCGPRRRCRAWWPPVPSCPPEPSTGPWP